MQIRYIPSLKDLDHLYDTDDTDRLFDVGHVLSYQP